MATADEGKTVTDYVLINPRKRKWCDRDPDILKTMDKSLQKQLLDVTKERDKLIQDKITSWTFFQNSDEGVT